MSINLLGGEVASGFSGFSGGRLNGGSLSGRVAVWNANNNVVGYGEWTYIEGYGMAVENVSPQQDNVHSLGRDDARWGEVEIWGDSVHLGSGFADVGVGASGAAVTVDDETGDGVLLGGSNIGRKSPLSASPDAPPLYFEGGSVADDLSGTAGDLVLRGGDVGELGASGIVRVQAATTEGFSGNLELRPEYLGSDAPLGVALGGFDGQAVSGIIRFDEEAKVLQLYDGSEWIKTGGYPGTSGVSGASGYSGLYSGFSGVSGASGFSGTFSGFSGWEGASGQSGALGSSGFSGLYSGFSGQEGDSGWSGAPGAITVIYKLETEAATGVKRNVLEDDAELITNVDANSTYEFEFGLKFQIQDRIAGTPYYSLRIPSGATAPYTSGQRTGDFEPVRFKGVLVTAGSGGEFALQWMSYLGTTQPGTLELREGSYMILRKVV